LRPISTQSNLFHSELFSQLDAKDPLIQLANTINWTVFDDAFEQHYSQDNGRPSKPIRLMVGLNEYRAYMKKAYKDQANSDLHRLSELYLIFVRNTLV
jgi:hypothetical protein